MNLENLTTLDVDLWKTLNIWVDMIKADESILQDHCLHCGKCQEVCPKQVISRY